MKTIVSFSFVLMLILGNLSCNAQETSESSRINGLLPQVEVYYFHFSSRCVTCKTVEAEAKADVESLYDGVVSFHAINLDEKSSEALADRLKVSGQSLLIVKGEMKINITNEGFLYARSNPKKFKAIIKEKIDSLLN